MMDFLIGENYASIHEIRQMKPSQIMFWAKRMDKRNRRVKENMERD